MQTVWLALAILFGIIEAATLGLTSIWFAVGALAAMICALLHGPIWLQVSIASRPSPSSMPSLRSRGVPATGI